MGKSIVYDTVVKKGWRVSIASHVIKTVITQILHEDWEDVGAGGRAVPLPVSEEDCTVRDISWHQSNRIDLNTRNATSGNTTTG